MECKLRSTYPLLLCSHHRQAQKLHHTRVTQLSFQITVLSSYSTPGKEEGGMKSPQQPESGYASNFLRIVRIAAAMYTSPGGGGGVPPFPSTPGLLPLPFLSPKLQGLFFCFLHLSPQSFCSTAHFLYPCDFLNKFPYLKNKCYCLQQLNM